MHTLQDRLCRIARTIRSRATERLALGSLLKIRSVGMLSCPRSSLLGALELIVTRPATRQPARGVAARFCTRALSAPWASPSAQQGAFPERGVVISNHMGYLDIMTFAALHRCVFVSKAEIGHVPSSAG